MKNQLTKIVKRFTLFCCLTGTLLFLWIQSAFPAVFNIADGDVAGLISAINTANGNDEFDIINLAAGGVYTLTSVNNTLAGPNGLPLLVDDVPGPDLTINGNGATIQRSAAGGTPDFRILQIQGGAAAIVTINNLTIAGGRAIQGGGGHGGGGIYNNGSRLTLVGCAVNFNSVVGEQGFSGTKLAGPGAPAFGGGLNSTGDTMIVTNCTFTGNSAQGGGGGSIFGTGNGADGGNGVGGAVYSSTSVLTLTNCVFTSNSTAGGSGGGSNASPGRGLCGGVSPAGGTLTSCTLQNNTATHGGGAVCGPVTVTGCTFSGNTTNGSGGGILNESGGAGGSIANTILKSGASGSNLSGSITSQGYNLSDDGGGGFLTATGDQINTDPMLDPAGLQNNGGPTQTIKLLAGSPAIDKGKSFGLSTDQRGHGRPDDNTGIANASGGDGSDIGAYEVPGSPQGGPSFVVTVISDHDDGGGASACTGDCTLREAINTANALAGDNTITFSPAVIGTIQLSGVLPYLSTNINLQGPGANVLTVRRNTGGDYRIFAVQNGSLSGPTVTISGLTITNGSDSYGGGIFNGYGVLTVSNCAITGNTGTNNGGGIYNQGYPSSATVTLSNSTLSNNSSNSGGAIENSIATATLTNCTISGNSAVYGGGIVNGGDAGYPAALTLRSCTISGNTAPNAGGVYNSGGFSGGGATLTVGNTIFKTGAQGPNVFNVGNPIIISEGYNLSSDGTGPNNGSTDMINTDPLLQPLANNGGPTQTHALLSNSPAINSGASNAPSRDQRYYLRSGAADRGAFEFGGVLAPISALSRKTHGSGGPTFDINLPVTGPVGIECRKGQGTNSNDHQVIMTFPIPVSLTNVSATPDPSPIPAATGSVSNFSVIGSQVTVNLTGVSNAQRLTITLTNVSDGVNTNSAFVLRAGMLLGDTSGNGSVNNSDITQTKGQSGTVAGTINFRTDVTVNGNINNSDITTVKGKSGTGLPP